MSKGERSASGFLFKRGHLRRFRLNTVWNSTGSCTKLGPVPFCYLHSLRNITLFCLNYENTWEQRTDNLHLAGTFRCKYGKVISAW